MKLSCKCGTILTNDLYVSKQWEVWDKVDDYGSEGNTKHYMRVKKGSFLLASQQFRGWGFKKNECFCVSPDDLFDQQQLEYASGYGCCGNHWKSYNCPSCGVEAGQQYLDCYDDLHVSFPENKVERVYR